MKYGEKGVRGGRSRFKVYGFVLFYCFWVLFMIVVRGCEVSFSLFCRYRNDNFRRERGEDNRVKV